VANCRVTFTFIFIYLEMQIKYYISDPVRGKRVFCKTSDRLWDPPTYSVRTLVLSRV